MKILLTGAADQLGQALRQQVPGSHSSRPHWGKWLPSSTTGWPRC